MSKKITAVFTAIIIVIMTLSGTAVFAEESYQSLLTDLDDSLTDEQESDLRQHLSEAAKAAGCNVGVIISADIHGMTAREYTEKMFDTSFGVNSDGVMLLINNDYESGYGDWLTAEGNAVERFGKQSDKVLADVYSGLNSGGFYGAVRSFCDYLCIEGSTEIAYRAVLNDRQDILTDEQIDILTEEMLEVANKLEINVGVVITDNIEGKTDKAFTDDYLDSTFGFGSSSIVLLFNNDRTNMNYTDWISTCGKCTDWYDSKTNRIFDDVYYGLDNNNNSYYYAIKEYCTALETYAGKSGSTQVGVPVSDYSDEITLGKVFINSLILPIIFGLVMALIVTYSAAAGYKRKKPVSAREYLENSRTRFVRQNDIFIREYHSSHSVSSGSSRGGGHHSGGGGHHSSSHSSHGGGGGRRR